MGLAISITVIIYILTTNGSRDINHMTIHVFIFILKGNTQIGTYIGNIYWKHCRSYTKQIGNKGLRLECVKTTVIVSNRKSLFLMDNFCFEYHSYLSNFFLFPIDIVSSLCFQSTYDPSKIVNWWRDRENMVKTGLYWAYMRLNTYVCSP